MPETTEGEWLEPVLENGWATGRDLQGVGPFPGDACRATIFTLPPRALERPRHYLVIYPGERGWEIEHDPTCPYEYSYGFAEERDSVLYRCEMADHLGYVASASRLPAGRYEIELARTYDGDGEWDVRLRVVRRVQIIATVVSV